MSIAKTKTTNFWIADVWHRREKLKISNSLVEVYRQSVRAALVPKIKDRFQMSVRPPVVNSIRTTKDPT
jgi:hypothetical protein